MTKIHASQETTTISVGPIPPPEMLQRYREVLPDAPERLLRMAEDQAIHRRAMERKALDSELLRSYLGIACAFTLAAAFLGCGTWLISLGGHDLAGGSIAGSGALGIAGTFLYGRRDARLERIEKTKIMAGQQGPVQRPHGRAG